VQNKVYGRFFELIAQKLPCIGRKVNKSTRARETGQSIVFVIGLRFVAPTNAHFMFNKQENRKRAKTREVKGKWELKGTLLPSLLGKTYIIRFFDFLLLYRK